MNILTNFAEVAMRSQKSKSQELELSEMEELQEKAFVFFNKTANSWQYSLDRPVGREDVDFTVYTDVDAAYNAVQRKNSLLCA